MTESTLYQSIVKPNLKKLGWFIYRVEHERVPDLYTAKGGRVLWLELKVVNKEKKNGIIKPDWRPGQLAWIKEHSKNGGQITALCLWYVGKVFILTPKKSYSEVELKTEEKFYGKHAFKE